MAQDNDGFFVGVTNPLDVRRNVLESSREMIQTLQSYEKIKKIRESKVRRIQQLRTVIRELDLLFSKLKSSLPKTHLRAKVAESVSSSKVKSSDSTKQMTELERLEEQLKEVEQEIARVS
ncbi:hypothetical protein JXB41_05650 [Candidatus Woesearchaeota archaeon]|nr:hypothetical protein [Candidatus Woesearchaeota archaeon]